MNVAATEEHRGACQGRVCYRTRWSGRFWTSFIRAANDHGNDRTLADSREVSTQKRGSSPRLRRYFDRYAGAGARRAAPDAARWQAACEAPRARTRAAPKGAMMPIEIACAQWKLLSMRSTGAGSRPGVHDERATPPRRGAEAGAVTLVGRDDRRLRPATTARFGPRVDCVSQSWRIAALTPSDGSWWSPGAYIGAQARERDGATQCPSSIDSRFP
jgi:hypothetical protein